MKQPEIIIHLKIKNFKKIDNLIELNNLQFVDIELKKALIMIKSLSF